MFNNTFKILFALSFLLLGGLIVANAQIEDGEAFTRRYLSSVRR